VVVGLLASGEQRRICDKAASRCGGRDDGEREGKDREARNQSPLDESEKRDIDSEGESPAHDGRDGHADRRAGEGGQSGLDLGRPAHLSGCGAGEAERRQLVAPSGDRHRRGVHDGDPGETDRDRDDHVQRPQLRAVRAEIVGGERGLDHADVDRQHQRNGPGRRQRDR